MSLQKWADNGWLRAHRTSRQELLAFVAELRDDVRRWLEERHTELVN